MSYKNVIFAFAVSVLFHVSHSWGCPGRNNILDYNCDGEVKIFFVGDSLVYGFGDSVNNNHGGYVQRLKKSLKNVTVNSYGVLGLRALTLLSTVTDTFKDGKDLYPSFRKNLDEADVVILDVGRNDRWLMGLPGKTYRNLNRIATLISSGVKKDTGYEPLVVKSVLMLPNRGAQGPWVKELNEIILAKSTDRFPSDLRFDLVSKRLIGFDQIHPTSLGYASIAKAFTSYLPDLKDHMKADRIDSDDDGIEDLFESEKFFTDPTKADTDGDGKSDTSEIFVTFTNPLLID